MVETVLKPFKTLDRVFAAGDSVSPGDIRGHNSFEQWQERGFVSGGAAPRGRATPVQVERTVTRDDDGE